MTAASLLIHENVSSLVSRIGNYGQRCIEQPVDGIPVGPYRGADLGGALCLSQQSELEPASSGVRTAVMEVSGGRR